MHTYLIEMLECPACHNQLDWHIDKQSDTRVEQAEAQCTGCSTIYPIRDGIGIFLTPDLPRNDIWAEVDSQLTQYLQEHPELEGKLMDVPYESLSPADQHFRAMVLEERGNFLEARMVEDIANKTLYTSEYTKCWADQVEFTIDIVSLMEGPVVDLASGRCYLVEKVAQRLKRSVVATDFSPNVLRRDRNLLEFLGLYEHVSLLAFDARRTPFKDNAIQIMTTNLGLPNIEEPGRLLQELRRIVNGTFLAISHFFPIDDEINGKVISEARLDALLYRDSALECFSTAGWNAVKENTCNSEARPTPPSDLFEGARADGLPVADTQLEWCVLRAT